jgi:predicted RNA-binding Zn-ribbon protein involved in translation (DUF1610 family)
VDTALLCETCGYSLQGGEAAPTDRCPECGTPVAESLPDRRPGSPWQRSPGLFSWAATVRHVLFRPASLFRAADVAAPPRGFLAFNLLLTGGLIVAPFTGVFIGDWARSARGQGLLVESIAYLSAFAAQALAAAAVLFVLTALDVYGIRLLARTRGWRLTPNAAWAVCAHASAGWLLAGALPLLFMANYYVVGTLLRVDFTGQVTSAAGAPRWRWQEVLGMGLPVLGYLSGLLAFELLALKGARVCRFANAASSAPRKVPA